MSCISSAAVDRLKLTHLVDTSIQANAVGVGQLKVSTVSRVITGHCQKFKVNLYHFLIGSKLNDQKYKITIQLYNSNTHSG